MFVFGRPGDVRFLGDIFFPVFFLPGELLLAEALSGEEPLECVGLRRKDERPGGLDRGGEEPRARIEAWRSGERLFTKPSISFPSFRRLRKVVL